MTDPSALIKAVLAAGGELLLTDSGRIRFRGPDTPEGHELVEQVRTHRDDVIRILRQQNSWPTPLSYPEYFCRLRAAGFVPCSREEWEAEHGSDAERMARDERLCRWGAGGEVVQ
jgi:hypothetical protein